MNWIWNVRTNDGAMNGLEFARCTTAGGFEKVLVHAAPAHASVEITTSEGSLVAKADLERDGDYTPMTLLERRNGRITRAEIWPTSDEHGLPVLLAGGEVGILLGWQHADDHSWWRWAVEFSNHVGAPPDWSPPARSPA